VGQSQQLERKLVAILAADVVGYSRLIGLDETGTVARLKKLRREFIEPLIAGYHGRVVKLMGDGALVEFASVVDAVACAIEIQRLVAKQGAGQPEDSRIEFRIGINLGDIIVEGADIFGDGVNVAARLETLCEPGGLCVSRGVRDQVRDRLPIVFDDLGEQRVKNIARTVRVFAMTPDAIAATPDLPASGRGHAGIDRRLWIGAAFAVILIAAGAAALWLLQPLAALQEVTGVSVHPSVEERASIAILPFVSLAEAGTNDDYFADGLTEDIISALGHFRDLSVVSRGGVFAYKGKNPTPDSVGRDLHVRYVVEGSIRRSPERIRVSVSLTDAKRAVLLWSERYDVELKDIFSVQDQISQRISGALAVQVTDLEIAQSRTKPPDNLEAYDLVLRARDALSRITRAGNAEARGLFERAIAIDPNYAPAFVGLGRVNQRAVTQGWTADPGQALERAETLARKAIELDDLSPGAHALLGTVYVYFGDYDRGLAELKRAIDLNGSDAESYAALVEVRLWSGDTEGAIAAGRLLSQFEPNLTATASFHFATALVLTDRSADAIALLEQAIDRNRTNAYTYVMLAAAYVEQGRQQDAKRMADTVRQRSPGFSGAEFGSLLRNASQREKLGMLLEKAGL
jgi:adenylate cyclase